MLVKLFTDKNVTEAAAALQAAVQANHFGVMQVHNLKETMNKKGLEFNSVQKSNSKKPGVLPCSTKPKH